MPTGAPLTAAPPPTRPTPNRIGALAIYLFLGAVVARTLLSTRNPDNFPVYLVGFLAFLALFSLAVWLPGISTRWLHLMTAAQCVLAVFIQALEPQEDTVNALFPIIGYEVGLIFRERARWTWAGILAFFCGSSLMLNLGVLEGLAKSALNMAGVFMFVAHFSVNQDLEKARAQSQAMLAELEATHQKLTTYASQVDELASVQERNRLARELHDSVSQTIFSLQLNTRAAQMLLQRNPANLKPQLERLQALSQSALVEMRGLISELRPRKE